MKHDIRLLIVDDNVATRYALRRRLERHGYEVSEAGTGGEGLALIASEKLDALILDVNLPDMSGFDIVRELRADARTALLPVIHVSAASIQTGDIITGLDAGADAYLIHPVDPDVLLATLRTLLRVRDTENALRESEARFREIFVNISAPIAVLDADLKVHECNHAFSQLIQDNRDPQTLSECFAEDQSAILDELRLRLVDGERWKGTLNMRVQGEIRETEWQISPYRTPKLSLVFVEDVTEHRHRERSHLARLDDTTTQLAKEVADRVRAESQLLQVQKMDALGKLTGGIAHDFNNLLTGIITSLELIQKRFADARPDKVQFYAEAALSSAMSAASLTHRLLAFARQQPLDTRPVDINKHVRSLEELLVRTIGERIALKLEMTTKPAIALVDPIQLESAVLNLVINARDALPRGGNIWVSTYAAYSHGDSNLADGSYVALSVRDDGTGIEHSVIDKVFEPFFTTKPLGQGTGLGLSMIYGFAKQSGGQVRVHSQVDRGTTMCIYLPRHRGDPVQSHDDKHIAPAVVPKASETILVVDDEPTVRALLTDVLGDLGYNLLEAGDSVAGLKVLQSNVHIDLLITDVGLPGGMNGRQLADAGREIRPNLTTLFITGYAENAVIGAAQLGPGMQVLTKPFAVDTLVARVSELMCSRSE